MSYSIDVNLLLYASDQDSPEYETSRRLFEDFALRIETFVLAWPTLYSYLRLATHSTASRVPLSPERAQANVERLLAWPQVRTVGHDLESWRAYQQLNSSVRARGNLVPDAQLAALLIRHGVRRIYTRDRDFRKFEGLEAVDPFS